MGLGALLGLGSVLPLLGALSLGARASGLPYVPFLLFEWLTRALPGRLVTAGIDAMVALISALGVGPTSAVAKAAEMGLAVAALVAGAAVLGAVLAGVSGRRPGWLPGLGAAAGAALWILCVAAMQRVGYPPAGRAYSALWLFLLLGLWGTLLGLVVRRAGRDEQVEGSRRRFLEGFALGVVALFAATVGLGRRWGRRAPSEAVGGSGAGPGLEATSGPAASPPEDVLARRVAPATPTRPELTDPDRFYRVDINLAPPTVREAGWKLAVDGLVSTPQGFTLEELRALPATRQAITLECISNLLGGDLMSTGVVTGVPLRDLLARVGRRPAGRHVYVESADGYFETVAPADVEDPRTLLVWALDGAPLTAEHGFPLRLYVPDRYGMKQPKWITRLEVTEQARPGYWGVRGWSNEARVKTTSVIDGLGASMRIGEADVMPVGGVAYSGAKGISRVEVQVDGGAWQPAQLRRPPLSPLSWVQWRFDWPYQAGSHTFRVRAYDGSGRLQPVEVRGPRPDGASGLFELTRHV
jgi:DMSO/TMAO reductase YedYZ molybdopterin-dependent catalytic subunit